MIQSLSRKQYKRLAEKLIVTARAAGRAQMEIFDTTFEVEFKQDLSPVTRADRVAEAIILSDLKKIAPNIPVVAEEAVFEGKIPEIDNIFFLVDALDGTREFIRKNREFTVNIALVDNGKPIFGLVYAPALGELYLTLAPDQAVMGLLNPRGSLSEIHRLDFKAIKPRPPLEDGLSVVVSKSHLTHETSKFIEQFSVREQLDIGSSLKFCLLAKGDADLYPRFGPTMEWDTAAGHALLNAAGGRVQGLNGEQLVYGKTDDNYRNPYFVAWAHK